jgi:N-acetylglucosamine-6-phosphate deacetylase
MDAMDLQGFVDLHTHGIGNYDTRTSDPEAILKMGELHYKAGTGAFLPTIYSGSLKMMRTNMQAVRRAMEMQQASPVNRKSSHILGLHLEGPFLNPLMCGALERESFLKPTLSNLRRLIEGYEEIIKIITISPELPGALMVIEKCSETGILVHMGHSDATYAQSAAGKKAGASGITHIFNAMRPFHHREPGLVGLGLLDEDLFVEVIADGVHLSPETLKLIFSLRKPGKIIIVSDSVKGARKRAEPVITEKGVLAGSSATISRTLAILRSTGISEAEIEEFCIANPLRHLKNPGFWPPLFDKSRAGACNPFDTKENT